MGVVGVVLALCPRAHCARMRLEGGRGLNRVLFGFGRDVDGHVGRHRARLGVKDKGETRHGDHHQHRSTDESLAGLPPQMVDSG